MVSQNTYVRKLGENQQRVNKRSWEPGWEGENIRKTVSWITTCWKNKPPNSEQHTDLLLVVSLQSGKWDCVNIHHLTRVAVQNKPDWKHTFFFFFPSLSWSNSARLMMGLRRLILTENNLEQWKAGHFENPKVYEVEQAIWRVVGK